MQVKISVNTVEGKKNRKYPPRANMVRYVDQVSDKIERDINACYIFVSKVAAEFAKADGFK